MIAMYVSRLKTEKFKDVGTFVQKECFDNTFHNVHHFEKHGCNVVMCWLEVIPGTNLYTRHACYELDGEILDLTLYHVHGMGSDLLKRKYYPFAILTPGEYFDYLERELLFDGTTGLEYTLHRESKDVGNKLIQHGNILI